MAEVTYNSNVITDLQELNVDQLKKATGSSTTFTNVPDLIKCLFAKSIQDLEDGILQPHDIYDLDNMTAYSAKVICDLTGAPYIEDSLLLANIIRGYCAAKSSSGTADEVLQAFQLLSNDSRAKTISNQHAAVSGEMFEMLSSDLLTAEEIADVVNAIMQLCVAAGVRWDGFGLTNTGGGGADFFTLDIDELSPDNVIGQFLCNYYNN